MEYGLLDLTLGATKLGPDLIDLLSIFGEPVDRGKITFSCDELLDCHLTEFGIDIVNQPLEEFKGLINNVAAAICGDLLATATRSDNEGERNNHGNQASDDHREKRSKQGGLLRASYCVNDHIDIDLTSLGRPQVCSVGRVDGIHIELGGCHVVPMNKFGVVVFGNLSVKQLI